MPLSAAQDYPLWINSLIFLVAAVFIWFAGTRLVRYLDAIAVKTGLGQAFVGMLLLGSITSLPEIANVMTSSWTGYAAWFAITSSKTMWVSHRFFRQTRP